MLHQQWKQKENKTGVINDPLGQTHSPDSSDHYSHLKFVLFSGILKSGNGRIDTTWKNSDHYLPSMSRPRGSTWQESLTIHSPNQANAQVVNIIFIPIELIIV